MNFHKETMCILLSKYALSSITVSLLHTVTRAKRGFKMKIKKSFCLWGKKKKEKKKKTIVGNFNIAVAKFPLTLSTLLNQNKGPILISRQYQVAAMRHGPSVYSKM